MNVDTIEYTLRRKQRGLGVLLKMKNPHQHQAQTHRQNILDYAGEIAALKKELYNRTGRCTPRIPRWPI